MIEGICTLRNPPRGIGCPVYFLWIFIEIGNIMSIGNGILLYI